MLKKRPHFSITVLDSQNQCGYGAGLADHTPLEWYNRYFNEPSLSSQGSFKTHCFFQNLMKLTPCMLTHSHSPPSLRTPRQCQGRCERKPRAIHSPPVDATAFTAYVRSPKDPDAASPFCDLVTSQLPPSGTYTDLMLHFPCSSPTYFHLNLKSLFQSWFCCFPKWGYPRTSSLTKVLPLFQS